MRLDCPELTRHVVEHTSTQSLTFPDADFLPEVATEFSVFSAVASSSGVGRAEAISSRRWELLLQRVAKSEVTNRAQSILRNVPKLFLFKD